MTVGDIFDFLDSRFPFSSAEDYDNPGLLVGDRNAVVTSAVVALDCTQSAIALAKKQGSQLIVTHHPVIFDPLKNVLAGSVVFELISSGISVICAHTNLDVGDGGVNDCLCNALGLRNVTALTVDGFRTRMGETEKALSPADFAVLCREKITCGIKYVDGGKPVKSVAVCGGSGGGMLDGVIAAGADAFVTSDIKHSVFIVAKRAGITLIDAGHFDTEDTVIDPLCSMLCSQFPDILFKAEHTSDIIRI